MIAKEFIINDIINYESINDINILSELECGETYIIVDLIMLGNKCTYEEAEDIFNKSLETMSIEDIIKDIAICLVGSEQNKQEKTVDRNNYKNFSSILMEFFEQLQIVDNNITYSEFMGMSTRMLYRYADGIQKRYINNRNAEYRESFENAAILLGALCGKIKEPPKINIEDINNKTSLADRVRAFTKSRKSGDV